MRKSTAYLAATVYTGNSTLHHQALIVKDGLIEDSIPAVSLQKELYELVDFGEAILAPAFMDIQLYGAYDRLLAIYPDAETVAAIYQYSKAGGAAYCMPTVATNAYETIFQCIDAVREYWKLGGKGVLGLHAEGPWINPIKKGAHIEALIFSPTLAQAKELVEYGKDVLKMITLAPEVCSDEVIDYLLRQDVLISAGHSNATYEQANESFEKGIPAATHLFNAMSAFQHRAPGLAGAVLDHAIVKAPIIPDGHHVDYAAIRIAKKIMGDRLFVITDAVTETPEGLYPHHLDGDKYVSNGILSGSALTMGKAVQNLVQHTGIDVAEALRMCSLYPARLLKKSDEFGLLKKGYRAEFVVLDHALNVLQTIV